MGFAEEVEQVNNVPNTEVEKPESEATPEGEVPKVGDEHLNNSLPVGESPVDPTQAKKVEQPPAPQPEPKIKIGTRTFDSVPEAMKYAEELEMARLEDKGFIEGVKAAKGEAPENKQEQMKALEEQVEEKFFEDPKTAIKMLIDGVKKIINDDMTVAEQQKAKVIEQQQKTEAMWTGFFTENPDLSESKDVVEYLLKKNWQVLANIPMNESLPKLAELARKQLKITKESALPKTELQSKKVQMPGASNGATANNSASTEEAPLDFVKQVNSIRRKSVS